MTYVLVKTKRGAVRLVMRRKASKYGFTVLAPLAKDKSGDLSRSQVKRAVAWAKKRGWTVVRTTSHPWPYVTKDPTTAWPTNKALLRKLNSVGRKLHRRVHVVSGWRTPHKCWELRMAYLRGEGNLAARCCSRYSGFHSWEDCGRDPWSNHADGNAADCGIIDRWGDYSSIGNISKARKQMHKVGLCLPVPGEAWHTEIGSSWAA